MFLSSLQVTKSAKDLGRSHMLNACSWSSYWTLLGCYTTNVRFSLLPSDLRCTHLHVNMTAGWFICTLKSWSPVPGDHPYKLFNALKVIHFHPDALQSWFVSILYEACLGKTALSLKRESPRLYLKLQSLWYFSKCDSLSAEIYCLFKEENGRLSEHADQ
jgi:hypothetical protein